MRKFTLARRAGKCRNDQDSATLERLPQAASEWNSELMMKAILASYDYSLRYLERQLDDLSANQMVAQTDHLPNHPAWTVGHLVASCQAVCKLLEARFWLPDDWAGKFGTGSRPVQDVAFYPERAELQGILRDARDRVAQAMDQFPAPRWAGPLPLDSPYREHFSSYRQAVGQMLAVHAAYHIGQLAVWRDAMNLPKLDQPYV